MTKFPVFEAANLPGGISASYYIRPNEKICLKKAPDDNGAYRFEVGGGHWIFGSCGVVPKFIHKFAETKNYSRSSAVYFAGKNLYVPYPIQSNLQYLDKEIVERALKDKRSKSNCDTNATMKDWLSAKFGRTLCELFFWPFHKRYTDGLYASVMPQDSYKSPAASKKLSVGYNSVFMYPKKGLDCLIRNIAKECDIRYGKRVVRIDTKRRRIFFSDGMSINYKKIISSLPLNNVIELAGLRTTKKTDPHTSVLVLNIGAFRGEHCPSEHWLYVPDSKSGFFRVGFYSNVDNSFLPRASQKKGDRVSIYVERAFKGGAKLSKQDSGAYASSVIKELQNWNFIKDVEVRDLSWVEVAYTWSWPGSTWVEEAGELLSDNDIYQIGRYGRWRFQGIADSISDGLNCSAYLS